MESFRQQRSPGGNSFIGLFSHPPPHNGSATSAASSTGGGDELDEDDIFWTGNDSSEPSHPSPKHPSSMASPNPNPSPSPSLYRTGHRRFPERNFGILAALPEEDKKRPLLQRKNFSPSSSITAAASPSSPSSSARIIPVVPKPKAEYAMSVPGGKFYHQSAPVNVPIVPPRAREGWVELDGDVREAEDIEEEEMLPPHEIVARAASKESPLTTFSMLEGVGRTLKGRDLRRVRNAVWRQTGFLD